MSGKRIILNSAYCKRCRMTLVSRHRHDYQACPCGNAVDGGLLYLRRVGRLDDLEELSRYES